MCMITIYRGTTEEKNKLAEEVSSYEMLFNEARIRAWSLMGEEKEFAIEHIVKWNSTDDTLVI